MYYRARVQKAVLLKKSSMIKYIEETLINHFQLIDSQDIIHIKAQQSPVVKKYV